MTAEKQLENILLAEIDRLKKANATMRYNLEHEIMLNELYIHGLETLLEKNNGSNESKVLCK